VGFGRSEVGMIPMKGENEWKSGWEERRGRMKGLEDTISSLQLDLLKLTTSALLENEVEGITTQGRS
jgi:hypothetical protein